VIPDDGEGMEIAMLSSQEDQSERRRVLANDQRVREQTGTFHSHTHFEEGGRFKVADAQIVGQTAVPNYPAASPPWQGPDLVGDEPPLSDPDLEPPLPAQAPDPPSAPLDVGSLSQGSADQPGSNVAGAAPPTFRRFR
jgi:hypothetical protein